MESGKVDTRTAGTEKSASGRRYKAIDTRFGMGGPVPIEWMDGFSWRLPSGKALAEFALQAGFLAPLMLNMPRPGVKKAQKKGKS
jgi:hypothetical protein